MLLARHDLGHRAEYLTLFEIILRRAGHHSITDPSRAKALLHPGPVIVMMMEDHRWSTYLIGLIRTLTFRRTVALFFLVRGGPALMLYRGELKEKRDRLALGFYSATELPLVVAITTIAVSEGHMRSSTAASLVGAAMLSTFAFPLVAMSLRKGRAGTDLEPRLQAA